MEEDRLQSLLRRIDASEQRVAKLSEEWQSRKNDPAYSDGVRKVQADLRKRLVFSYQFSYVPSNYYDMDLEQRATLLKASAPQLCKSILFENTVWEGDDEFDPTNARYYCVIVQYVAKINTQSLRNLIHSQRSFTKRLSKNSFNFQLVPDDKSALLSGFEHNAISPFGMTESRIPIVVDSRITELSPPVLYLGGGHVDAKISLPVSDLLISTKAIVGAITELR